jgi:hypothetical protein
MADLVKRYANLHTTVGGRKTANGALDFFERAVR